MAGFPGSKYPEERKGIMYQNGLASPLPNAFSIGHPPQYPLSAQNLSKESGNCHQPCRHQANTPTASYIGVNPNDVRGPTCSPMVASIITQQLATGRLQTSQTHPLNFPSISYSALREPLGQRNNIKITARFGPLLASDYGRICLQEAYHQLLVIHSLT